LLERRVAAQQHRAHGRHRQQVQRPAEGNLGDAQPADLTSEVQRPHDQHPDGVEPSEHQRQPLAQPQHTGVLAPRERVL
jgi:hypothetical protein